MQATRTNPEWVQALTGANPLQVEALSELRELLLRAALYTLATHVDDLRARTPDERLALAEDCAQEATLAVLSRIGDFRGDSKFTTWAYKFGINVALARARRERWKGASLDSLSEEEDTDWLERKIGAGVVDSEAAALRSEVAGMIQDVINTELTERQRQVLHWIAFDDVPMDVVVERLETNRNAVYKLLHDARLKVKRRLSTHGYEVEDIYDLFR